MFELVAVSREELQKPKSYHQVSVRYARYDMQRDGYEISKSQRTPEPILFIQGFQALHFQATKYDANRECAPDVESRLEMSVEESK